MTWDIYAFLSNRWCGVYHDRPVHIHSRTPRTHHHLQYHFRFWRGLWVWIHWRSSTTYVFIFHLCLHEHAVGSHCSYKCAWQRRSNVLPDLYVLLFSLPLNCKTYHYHSGHLLLIACVYTVQYRTNIVTILGITLHIISLFWQSARISGRHRHLQY